MKADSRRTFGWILIGSVLVLAALFALRVLRSPDAEPAPAADSGRTMLERPTPAPRGPDIEPPPDRAPPPPAEPTAPRAGAVTGRVMTPDRRVMKDARIEAFRGSSLGAPLFQSVVALGKRTPVDEEGRFTLSDVPPMADLMLRVDGAGFAVTDAGPFVVAAGQTTDVGDLLVSAGLTLAGSVQDARGRPVAGARIGLFQGTVLAEDGDQPPRPDRLVLSDADGRYRIANARTAPFTLRASAAGYANAEVAGAPMPGDSARELTVPIVLQPSRTLGGLVIGTPDGAPLPGARVFAQPVEPGLGGSETKTDATGRFAFDDLAAGRYIVRGSARGRSEATAMADTSAAEADIELQLPAQGTLSGIVLGEKGEPVGRFDLQPLFRSNPNDPAEPRGASQRGSDGSGEFLVDGLDAGFWSVQVWARGYAVTESERVRVRQGEHVGGLSVTLLRGGTLAGVVQDESGKPVAGAELWLNENRQPAIEQPGIVEKPRLVQSARTDAEGRFTIDEITPRAWQVVVDHPDFALHRRDDVVVAAGEDQELPPFVLRRAGTVEGVATTGSGQLLAGVTVYLTPTPEDAGGERQTTTDGKGRFLFHRIRPGTYVLACYGREPSLATILQARALMADPSRAPAAFPINAGERVTRNVVSAE